MPRPESGEALRKLVAAWADCMAADLPVGEQLPGGAEGVLLGPASVEDITAAERRLGVALPAFYKQFLRLTNGALASGSGPAIESDPSTGFLPVEQVQPVVVAARGLLMWTEQEGLNDPENQVTGLGAEGEEVRFFEPLERALVISGASGPDVDLLVPVGRGWQLWTMYKEGATAYRSVADLLRERVGQGRLDSGAGDELIARIRDGEVAALWHLLDARDPRAFDMAVEVLESPEIFDRFAERLRPTTGLATHASATRTVLLRAAHVFSALKDPRGIDPLRRALPRAVGDARGSVYLALIGLDPPDVDGLVCAAAHDPERRVWRWAIEELHRRGGTDEALAIVREHLAGPEGIGSERTAAVEILISIGPPGLFDELHDLMAKGPDGVVRAAVRRIGHAGRPELWPLVIDAAFDSRSASVRQAAAEALAANLSDTDVEVLRRVASDESAVVRKAALDGLLLAGDRSLPELLQIAADDRDPDREIVSLRRWAKKQQKKLSAA